MGRPTTLGWIVLVAFFVSTAVVLWQFAASLPQPPPAAPSASPSPAPLAANFQTAEVIGVVDGDTIRIKIGDTVDTLRFIGIDTPETVAPNRPVGCYGREASEQTKNLLLGKLVYLERDVSERDRFQRLLRYVYLAPPEATSSANLQMVNQLLVAEGFAQASAYPPDIKYQTVLDEAERQARAAGKGLWGAVCAGGGSPTPPVSPGVQGAWTCDCSKTCSQMSSCEEAQFFLKTCGCSERDGDGNGVACDSRCR